MPGGGFPDGAVVNRDGRHGNRVEVAGEIDHRHWQSGGDGGIGLVGDEDKCAVARPFAQPARRGPHHFRKPCERPSAVLAGERDNALENPLDESQPGGKARPTRIADLEKRGMNGSVLRKSAHE